MIRVLSPVSNIMNIRTSSNHSITIWQNLNISNIIFIVVIFIDEQFRWTIEWFVCEFYFKCSIFYPNLATHVTHNEFVWQIIGIYILWTNWFNKIAHTFDISVNWKCSVNLGVSTIAILKVTFRFTHITIINLDFK